MSYPKNAATPPRIAVGAVVQISDGAVQTSGVSIRVVPQGGSAAAGLGTTTYEDGIVLYAPTQAETNYNAFCVIAYKTGCIPAATTIVTSDTATAGRVRLSGETHSGATIPTVTVVTNRVSANTDQWGGVAVTGMPMPTYTQPAGFLAATFPATVASTTNITTVGAVSGSVGSVTGNVGGNVSGSVGSISGVTFPSNFASLAITAGGAVTAGTVSDKTGYSLTQVFPANFASLGINASGHISRVTLVDTTTTNTDMRGTDNAALASIWTPTVAGRIDAAISSRSNHSAADVWSVATRTLTAFSFSVTVGTNNDKTGYSLATPPLDASGTAAAVWGALLSSYTSNTTFGGRIMRTDSASAGNGAKVTGAGHVASDIHELQPAVIQATHFDLGAIDANALAADAAAQVATAVRSELATELGRIDATTSSRASQTSVDTLTGYVDTEVAAIKAKTDNLPANPAAVGDIPTAVAIADAVLSRSVASVETTAGEHTLCTLVLAVLESDVVGSSWTIKRTNGSTTHYVKTVGTDANALPIVSVQ